MLTIPIAWLIITFVLFSIGDISLHIYNKLCKVKEQYSFLDTFILGFFFMLIPLQSTSLWLPSNQCMLLAYIIICSLYWIFNYKKAKQYISSIKNSLKEFKNIQLIILLIPAIAILVYCYIFDHFYDAEYYHYQQIRWNEEYKAIPGLGNLEDRFGFNSNYLLISAIFSFRSLFGDAQYTIQGLLYIFLICWSLANIFKSGYDIRYIIILGLLFMIIFTDSGMFGTSSTDIIPILCTFYYIIKIAINPKDIAKKPLFYFLLPVALVTFKLSTGVLCFISIYILICLLKKKDYKRVTCLIISGSLIIILWFARNVIITGYLIYPLYKIDLFSFDWKMPYATVMLQEIHIHEYAKLIGIQSSYANLMNIFSSGFTSLKSVSNFINILFSAFIIIIPFAILYKWIRKTLNKTLLPLYLFFLLCLMINFILAPDFRFCYGIFLGIIFISIQIIFLSPYSSKKMINSGKYMVTFFLVALCLISTNKFITASKRIEMKFDTFIDFVALYHHRSAKNLNSFKEYNIGNYSIYITENESDHRTFDILPAIMPLGLPTHPFHGSKIQGVETIESRGNKPEDGFRTKKEYVDLLNKNAEKYKEEYYNYYHLK